MKKRLLVLFLGNILRGDDGIGIELLKRISRRDLPEDIDLEEGSTGGMILLGIIENYDKVLVVDAVDTGDLSRDVVIFSPDNILEGNDNLVSLHSISLKDIIKFNKILGEKTPEIIIFGVQVHNIDEHIGLSPKLNEIIDKLEEKLYRFIQEFSSKT